ncbi:MAG: MBL fold metallo-hydrolase [Alphaproteobacteria bacterium]|nr:MBL fold metallo-hydrolase [Alphaproteobacteria bacterium]
MSPEIIPVFCNQKNMANYAYIIKAPQTDNVVIIDAAETVPVLKKLEELNLTPTHILTTHHHFDHVGGNLALKEKYNLKIIAPEKEFSTTPGADIPAVENQDINLNGLTFSVIDAPGHTLGHVLYHLKQNNALFTGDVLFNLCVGGLFEGTPAQMFESLQKIKKLSDDTLIFPGHEYTRSCLPPCPPDTPEFNTYLKKMLNREQGLVSPATLKEEKNFNPYLIPQTFNAFLGQE